MSIKPTELINQQTQETGGGSITRFFLVLLESEFYEPWMGIAEILNAKKRKVNHVNNGTINYN